MSYGMGVFLRLLYGLFLLRGCNVSSGIGHPRTGEELIFFLALLGTIRRTLRMLDRESREVVTTHSVTWLGHSLAQRCKRPAAAAAADSQRGTRGK